MPKAATYKLHVHCPEPDQFTLNSVITSPRTCNPLSLAAACRNVSLQTDDADVPSLVSACAQFILTDFFALAHRTGLYNRQKALWESIGRITDVEAHRMTEGFFQKVDLPILELHFYDGRGRMALLGHLIEDGAFLDDDRKQHDYLRSVISRAEKLKGAKGLSGGIVIFCPNPAPKNLLIDLSKQTSGDDPIGKYESLLPEPVLLAIDLIEYEFAPPGSGESAVIMRLSHPDIAVDTRAPKNAAR